MKILTGVYTRDAGTVLVDGREVHFKSPQEAEKAGIVFIHQELNVLFDLTEEENLFMGKEIKTRFDSVTRRQCEKSGGGGTGQARRSYITVGGDVQSVRGQQQMIEICKALMVDAKVIIMDEPTAALTQSETMILFEVIQPPEVGSIYRIYFATVWRKSSSCVTGSAC